MESNIRYKGHINITSGIIFFRKSEIPRDVTLLERTSSEVFVMLVVHFWSSLCCCCILICRCSSFCCCIFSFSSRRHPSQRSVDYRWGFYTPFYTFSPAHHRVIRDTFIFWPFHLATSATALNGHFLPTCIFYLALLHQHFNLRLQGFFPGSPQFFLVVCRASYLSSKHRPGPSVCLIQSNPQTSYSERFSFKFYHVLA